MLNAVELLCLNIVLLIAALTHIYDIYTHVYTSIYIYINDEYILKI